MSETIGHLSLQADEEGMVTLQCSRCNSRFKMEASYLNDELGKNEIWCPSCGISNELKTFWPEEAVEEAKKIAINAAEQMIADAFKGLNSKYIKVKPAKIPAIDKEITLKNKDYNMKMVKVSCCNKKMGLESADELAGFYCAYCGRIIK